MAGEPSRLAVGAVTFDQWSEVTGQPVPDLFRPVAKQKIAGRIGEILLEEKAKKMEMQHIIRGYIQATPKRDHKFLRKKLKEMQVDMTPYEHLFD
mgnify:CR=1 FL=1